MVTLLHIYPLRSPDSESKNCQDSHNRSIQKAMLERQICHCCSSHLLRHIRKGNIYWRCSHCRQEMPILTVSQNVSKVRHRNRTSREKTLQTET